MRDKIANLEQKAMNKMSENNGLLLGQNTGKNRAGTDIAEPQQNQVEKLARKLRNREFDLKKIKSELTEA